MIGRLAYDAAKWQAKAYKQSRNDQGGPYTALSFAFLTGTFAAAWPFADLLLGRPVPVAAWIVPLVLLAIGVTGFSKQAGSRSRRLAQYDRLSRPDPTTTPEFFQERADLLEELEAQRRIMTGRQVSADTSPRVVLADTRTRRVAGLLATGCPVNGCSAGVGDGCLLRPLGMRFAIVRLEPLVYCHVERMAAAVLNGTAAPELVLAQFDNRSNVPQDLLKIIDGARKESDDRDDTAQPAEPEPAARSPRTGGRG